MLFDLKSLIHPLRKRLKKAWIKLENNAADSSILLAPGECFVCQKVDLPEGLQEKEITSFAECTLEGSSPFPLDQLAWGYLREKRARHILLYAALQKTLQRRGITEWERYYHAFPHFIAGVGLCFNESTVDFLSYRSSLSALFYEPDNPLPIRVESIRIDSSQDTPENNEPMPEEKAEDKRDKAWENDSLNDLHLKAARNELIAFLNLDLNCGYTLKEHIRRIEEPCFDREKKLRFPSHIVAVPDLGEEQLQTSDAPETATDEHFNEEVTEANNTINQETSDEPDDSETERETNQEASGQEALALPFTQEQLWEADSRDKGFIEKENKKRQLSKKIDMAAVAAGVTGGALIAAQAGFQVGDIVLDNRQAVIEARQAEVLMVENNAKLLGQLRQFAQGDLRLFEILELMNKDRPETVYFTQAITKGPGELEVDGSSKNVEDLNRYVDQLNALTYVEAKPVFKSSDTEGTAFQLTVTVTASADVGLNAFESSGQEEPEMADL